MKWLTLTLVALLSTSLAAPHNKQTKSQLTDDTKDWSSSDDSWIDVDVAILGGGAAGTYAAIRLQDEGKKVVVIERNDHLGGHVDTFSLPGTSVAIDYGVIAYLELPGTRDFFSRFGIDLISATSIAPNYTTELIDFTTGQPITSGNTIDAALDPQAVAIALGTYGQLAAEYAQYTFPSLSQLPPAPNQPEDLSLTFGDFVQKYNLQAALPTLFQFVEYVGDLLQEPTAYILNLYGAVQLNGTANGGLLIPTTYNNSVLYARAADQLGDSVLFSSEVTDAKRDNVSVTLKVNGGDKKIKAKKLLVTIPPLTDILSPLNLDDIEQSIFEQWQYQSVYAAVLTNTSFPDNTNIVNGVIDSSPDVLNLPGSDGQPFVPEYYFTGVPSFFRTIAIGGEDFTAQEAQALIIQEAGEGSELVAFASHAPLEVRATPQGLLDGFYQQAFGLNGHLGTYYAGAAWASDYTTVHWLYIEEVILPLILAAL